MFDARAILRRAIGADPMPSPMDAEEQAVVVPPVANERFAHHQRMAVKASSPAARRLHQKLMAHYKNKQ